MAAELGSVRLGTLSGTLMLRLDDGTVVEVGRLDVPLDVHVGVTMPAATGRHDVSDGDDERGEPDEPEFVSVPLDRERIDALPVGSVIADKDGDRVERRADAWHRMTTYGQPTDVPLTWSGAPSGTYGPYTLVSMPEPERPLQVGDRVRVRDDVEHVECRGMVGTIGSTWNRSLGDGGMSANMRGDQSVNTRAGGHDGPVSDFERIG